MVDNKFTCPTLKQLIKIHQAEEVIKKSTFIAIIAPMTSLDLIQPFLDKHSDFSATHNCWAYNIGQSYRFNDDGEPSGTAGKPILNAIQGQDFDNTIALVIRYYGGIKLGTGGLMRAYGGGVSRCLQSAEFEVIQDFSDLTINVPFAYIQSIHNLTSGYNALITSEVFNETGAVLDIKILSKSEEEFIQKATNTSRGLIKKVVTTS